MKKIRFFVIGIVIGMLITFVLAITAVEAYKFLSKPKTIAILKDIGRHVIKKINM